MWMGYPSWVLMRGFPKRHLGLMFHSWTCTGMPPEACSLSTLSRLVSCGKTPELRMIDFASYESIVINKKGHVHGLWPIGGRNRSLCIGASAAHAVSPCNRVWNFVLVSSSDGTFGSFSTAIIHHCHLDNTVQFHWKLQHECAHLLCKVQTCSIRYIKSNRCCMNYNLFDCSSFTK